MIFTTDYSKEQIISILHIYTSSYDLSNYTTPGIFVSKYKNNKVYLWYTGDIVIGSGQLPLVIEIINNDNNVTLKCKFGFTPQIIIPIIIFVGIVWIFIFSTFILNSDSVLEAKLISFFAVLLWTFLCVFQFPVFNKMFYSKRQEAEIEFIETHFDAKRIS